MQQLIIGKYIPGQSLVHQLDPRAKLTIVFLYVFIVFLANNVASYSLLLVFSILPLVLSRVPVRYIATGLKPVLWIFLFTFLLHVFTTKEGAILFQVGWFSIYGKNFS